MSAGCHGPAQQGSGREGLPKLALVGSPNVGKSAVFNRLTGMYVVVSNYPGTTVEVARGRARIGALEIEVIDTPGMYSLAGISEEERVTRRLLVEERPDLIAHVVDAKALKRMLPLTMELSEADWPLILAVNLLDEAEKIGVQVDLPALEKKLGIPVVGMAVVKNVGIGAFKRLVESYLGPGAQGGAAGSGLCSAI